MTEPNPDQLAFRSRLEALGVPGPWRQDGPWVMDSESDPVLQSRLGGNKTNRELSSVIAEAVNAAAGYDNG